MNAQPTQLADYAARRTSAKRREAAAAIRRIDQRAGQITFAAVAREAGVDRSIRRPTWQSRSPTCARRPAHR
jgi:hypothetical protein